MAASYAARKIALHCLYAAEVANEEGIVPDLQLRGPTVKRLITFLVSDKPSRSSEYVMF